MEFLWSFYQTLELREKQIDAIGEAAPSAIALDTPASPHPAVVEGGVAASSMTAPEIIVTCQLMSVCRALFIEIRRGALLDCLFELLRATDDESLAALVQEYIWAAWTTHHDKVGSCKGVPGLVVFRNSHAHPCPPLL
jgi:hypothetical protein